VVDAWSNLPEALKAGIIAMVKAVKARSKGKQAVKGC
jgi:hypothetical protein